MAKFRYKAKDLHGKVQKGNMEADTKQAAIASLRDDGLYVFEISQENATEIGSTHGKKLKTKHLVLFCRQLSAALTAGVVLVNALEIIYDSTPVKQLKAATHELYEGVQKGTSLSESMEAMGNVWPVLLINMVATGEASGTLDNIMEKMSVHYEKEQQLNSKIRTAMIYPIILGILSVVVVIFMLTCILPQFLNTFEGMEVPWPTQMLLNLSDIITTKWWLLIMIGIAIVVGWKAIFSKEKPRLALDKFKLKIFIIGKLLRTIYTARFASTFAILYGSGISMLRCIEIASKVIPNAYIGHRLTEVDDDLRRGIMLSESLNKAKIFDGMFNSMVLTGENSGSLDSVLSRTGDFFQQEADTATSRLVAMLEPVMIVFLALIVGFIVISIILPIYGMYSQIN